MRLAEKVARNVGILRRELAGKHSSLVESVVEEAALLHRNPVLSRAEFARLITDEEMANVEYIRLAEDPFIKEVELARSTIMGIAEDEKRHAQQLRDVLDLLVKEGKIP